MSVIECRDCNEKNCNGCNIYTLAQMLNHGKFGHMMDDNNCIQPDAFTDGTFRLWIPIAEKLPMGHRHLIVRCLFHTGVNGIVMDYPTVTTYRDGKFACSRENVEVTHWMAFPGLPRDSQEAQE